MKIHKCSFCNKEIAKEQIMLDLKGNEYCIYCAHQKLFAWQDDNIAEMDSKIMEGLG